MAAPVYEAVVLVPSAAQTADGQSDAMSLMQPALGGKGLPGAQGIAFVLDVTAAAVGVDDTLDVAIQTKLDGTNWVSVVAFTQVLGNGGAKRHIGKITNGAALTMFEAATALSAGSVRNLMGKEWRASWVIVDGGAATSQSFTFSVTAIPM